MRSYEQHVPPQPITVLIADDHPSVRAGLRLLLETAEGLEVVGEAADGAAAHQQVTELAPDVVLMDARMPGTDGIEATRQILQGSMTPPRSEVLMLTTFDLDEVVFGALRAGAAGFLLKSVEPARLIEAIRQVAAGDGVIAPEVTRRLLDAFAGTPEAPHLTGSSSGGPHGTTPPEPTQEPAEETTQETVRSSLYTAEELAALLTPRELDILAALGRGLSNAEIAEELFISLATVKTHVSAVLTKLHLSSRMQAAIRAREVGLV